MTRRTRGLLTAVVVVVVVVLTASPAGAQERYAVEGHACDFHHVVLWEDGALISVALQFDDREHPAPVTLNGTRFDSGDYRFADGATVLWTDTIPNTDTVTITSGDCTATITGTPVHPLPPVAASAVPRTVDAPGPLTTRYAPEPRARVLPTR